MSLHPSPTVPILGLGTTSLRSLDDISSHWRAVKVRRLASTTGVIPL